MNGKDRLRNSFLFLLRILFLAIIGSNVYLVSQYRDFELWFRTMVGMSKPQFSGLMTGVVLILTTFVIALTMASKKKETQQTDYSFILRIGVLFTNYVLLYRVVNYEGSEPSTGVILVVVTLIFAFVACIVLSLLHNISPDDQLYLLCWAHAFAIPLMVIVALTVHFPSQALRQCFNCDISDYFINPPVTAALLTLPHFLVSFTNPSRQRGIFMRIVDIIIYGSFIVLMVAFVPGTINNVKWYDAFSGNKWLFKAVVVVLYLALSFISLEVLRPETYALPGKRLFVLVLKHIALLLLVSASVGVLLYSVAALSGGVHRFILFGHALVGMVAGLIIPLWYAVYEKTMLPKLYSLLGLCTRWPTRDLREEHVTKAAP